MSSDRVSRNKMSSKCLNKKQNRLGFQYLSVTCEQLRIFFLDETFAPPVLFAAAFRRSPHTALRGGARYLAWFRGFIPRRRGACDNGSDMIGPGFERGPHLGPIRVPVIDANEPRLRVV